MQRSAMIRTMFVCIALSTAVACSSSVKRGTATEPPQTGSAETVAAVAQQRPLKVREIELGFTPAAREKYKENVKFDPGTFQSTLQRTLAANDLLHDGSSNRLRVTISDVRVRSNFSAVMFGFMAGTDHITGDVAVVDGAGATIDAFEVSASYALGGLGGGQDAARLDWLYEEFAKLTLKELSEKPGE